MRNDFKKNRFLQADITASMYLRRCQQEAESQYIEMAHVLGLFVVAEGVETAAQQQLLAALGCDCLQGYYFCRPIDETAAIRFLESKKTLAH